MPMPKAAVPASRGQFFVVGIVCVDAFMHFWDFD